MPVVYWVALVCFMQSALYMVHGVGPNYYQVGACSLASALFSVLVLSCLEATYFRLSMCPVLLFASIMAERVYWLVTFEDYSLKKARRVTVVFIVTSAVFMFVASLGMLIKYILVSVSSFLLLVLVIRILPQNLLLWHGVDLTVI